MGTRACPYCAEQIQDAAVKCRFCGSSLEGGAPASAVSGDASVPTPFGLVARPNAEMAVAHAIYGGQPSWKTWFWQYVGAAVTAPALVGLVWLAVLELRRRGTHYRISDRSIEVESGVFSKRIETMQLWRVKDMQFSQSVMDRVLGVAHIHVFTRDATDPDLLINGLPGSRGVFEQLKNAADLARQGRNVIGVVE